MKKIKKYLLKLNWFGFTVVLLLCMLGALLNDSVNSFAEWLLLVIIFGIPFSLFFLFGGKKD